MWVTSYINMYWKLQYTKSLINWHLVTLNWFKKAKIARDASLQSNEYIKHWWFFPIYSIPVIKFTCMYNHKITPESQGLIACWQIHNKEEYMYLLLGPLWCLSEPLVAGPEPSQNDPAVPLFPLKQCLPPPPQSDTLASLY